MQRILHQADIPKTLHFIDYKKKIITPINEDTEFTSNGMKGNREEFWTVPKKKGERSKQLLMLKGAIRKFEGDVEANNKLYIPDFENTDSQKMTPIGEIGDGPDCLDYDTEGERSNKAYFIKKKIETNWTEVFHLKAAYAIYMRGGNRSKINKRINNRNNGSDVAVTQKATINRSTVQQIEVDDTATPLQIRQETFEQEEEQAQAPQWALGQDEPLAQQASIQPRIWLNSPSQSSASTRQHLTQQENFERIIQTFARQRGRRRLNLETEILQPQNQYQLENQQLERQQEDALRQLREENTRLQQKLEEEKKQQEMQVQQLKQELLQQQNNYQLEKQLLAHQQTEKIRPLHEENTQLKQKIEEERKQHEFQLQQLQIQNQLPHQDPQQQLEQQQQKVQKQVQMEMQQYLMLQLAQEQLQVAELKKELQQVNRMQQPQQIVNQEMENLKDQIAKLREEKIQLGQESKTLREQSVKLHEEKQTQVKDIQDLNQQIDTLRHNMQEQETQHIKEKQELQETNKREIESIQQQHEQQIKELKHESQKIIAESAKLQNENQLQEDIIINVNQQIDVLRTVVSQSEEKLNTLQENMRSQDSKHQDEIKKLLREKNQQETTIQQQSKQEQQYKMQIKNMEQESKKLEKQSTQLQEKEKKQQQIINNFNQNLDKLNTETGQLKQTLNTMQNEMHQKMQDQELQHQNEKQELQKKQKQQETTIQEQHKIDQKQRLQIEKLKQELEKIIAQSEKLKKEKQQQGQDIKKLNSTIDQFTKDREYHEQELRELQNIKREQEAQMKAQLEDKNSEINQLRQNNMKLELELELSNNTQVQDDLKQTILKERTQQEQLVLQLEQNKLAYAQSIQEEKQNQEQKLQKLQNEYSSLEQQLITTQNKLQTLEQSRALDQFQQQPQEPLLSTPQEQIPQQLILQEGSHDQFFQPGFDEFLHLPNSEEVIQNRLNDLFPNLLPEQEQSQQINMQRATNFYHPTNVDTVRRSARISNQQVQGKQQSIRKRQLNPILEQINRTPYVLDSDKGISNSPDSEIRPQKKQRTNAKISKSSKRKRNQTTQDTDSERHALPHKQCINDTRYYVDWEKGRAFPVEPGSNIENIQTYALVTLARRLASLEAAKNQCYFIDRKNILIYPVILGESGNATKLKLGSRRGGHYAIRSQSSLKEEVFQLNGALHQLRLLEGSQNIQETGPADMQPQPALAQTPYTQFMQPQPALTQTPYTQFMQLQPAQTQITYNQFIQLQPTQTQTPYNQPRPYQAPTQTQTPYNQPTPPPTSPLHTLSDLSANSVFRHRQQPPVIEPAPQPRTIATSSNTESLSSLNQDSLFDFDAHEFESSTSFNFS